MYTRPTASVAISGLFALAFLALLFWVVPASAETSREQFSSNRAAHSSMSKSGSDSPTQQGIPPLTATAQTVGGMKIPFATNNGASPTVSSELPYLVLRHEDGRLTPAISRTLVVTVSNVEVPLTGVTVTIEVDTQDGDPDSGGNVGGAPVIPVWRESQRLTNTSGVVTHTSAVFTHEFTDSILYNGVLTTTPTDYFQYFIFIDNSLVPAIPPNEYAFLMDNQFVQPLPQVREDGQGMAPDELIVYYADMFPFSQTPVNTWLKRGKVEEHIRDSFLNMVATVFDTEVNTWGLGPLAPTTVC